MSALPGQPQASHRPARVLNLDWQDDALCREIPPEIFFPEAGPATYAKKICGSCDVRIQCLAFAMDRANDVQEGVWGGLTERERKRLRKAS